MKGLSVTFTAPKEVSVVEGELPVLGSGQVLVRTLFSAISPGSEMLLYRGDFPQDIPLDENLPALAGEFAYPLKYGYSLVGEVVEAGTGVDSSWVNRLVFAFQPHTSHIITEPEVLLPLPEDLNPEEALFLPNMETAINFLMDGAPMIGEKVIVFGQGIVGLLTTALLSQYPLADLITLDRYELRRSFSLALGARICLDPGQPDTPERLLATLPDRADLSYELSGAPDALNQAIAITGYNGRVVIGSWYGGKRADLDLGGHFHRSRIRLISSQVSTIAPDLRGRWTKARRFNLAWEMIKKIQPSRFITHRLPVERASEAYQLIDQKPEESVQVVFTYQT
jgi:2-desacetyl-2-hydroxyethyl bacteriochlorophyllide A dehydrogenase